MITALPRPAMHVQPALQIDPASFSSNTHVLWSLSFNLNDGRTFALM